LARCERADTAGHRGRRAGTSRQAGPGALQGCSRAPGRGAREQLAGVSRVEPRTALGQGAPNMAVPAASTEGTYTTGREYVMPS